MKLSTIAKTSLVSAVAVSATIGLQAQEEKKWLVSGGVGYLDEYVWRGLEIQDDVIKPEAGISYLLSDSLTLSANATGYLATSTELGEQEDEWNLALAASFKPQDWWLSFTGGVTYYHITYDFPSGVDDSDDWAEPFVGANISVNELFGAEEGLLADGDILSLGSYVYFELGDFIEGETYEQVLTYTLPIDRFDFINSASLISRWGYRDIELDYGFFEAELDYVYYGAMIEADIPLSEVVGIIPEGISLKPSVRYDSSEDKDEGLINSGDTFRNVTWGVSITGTF